MTKNVSKDIIKVVDVILEKILKKPILTFTELRQHGK